MHLIGPAVASFFLCLLAMLALRPIAIAVKLIDRPGGRKLHDGDIPVVGGLCIFLGMVLGIGLLSLADWQSGALLAACSILVTVGLIDDRFELSPWTRLSVQITASAILMLGAGATVNTLGAAFGPQITLDGIQSYALTVVCMIAAINAFNMLDGMDGLAGALAMVALAAVALLANQSGNVVALSISMVIMGAVAAFLTSNLPLDFNRNVRCFMGDSGSTLLGISVVWLCIGVTQGTAPAVKPVTILWVVAIPLYDLVWTVIRRSVRGIPPFRSDQGHFHHMLLQAGIGVKGSVALLFSLAVILAAFGVGLDRLGIADYWSMALLIATGVLIVRQLHDPSILLTLVRQIIQYTRSVSRAIPESPE